LQFAQAKAILRDAAVFMVSYDVRVSHLDPHGAVVESIREHMASNSL
jgi:hypothetical protein